MTLTPLAICSSESHNFNNYGRAPNWMVECSFTNYVVVVSNQVTVVETLDMAPALSKDFLDIQANYRMWIHSEARTWNDNNLQSKDYHFGFI